MLVHKTSRIYCFSKNYKEFKFIIFIENREIIREISFTISDDNYIEKLLFQYQEHDFMCEEMTLICNKYIDTFSLLSGEEVFKYLTMILPVLIKILFIGKPIIHLGESDHKRQNKLNSELIDDLVQYYICIRDNINCLYEKN